MRFLFCSFAVLLSSFVAPAVWAQASTTGEATATATDDSFEAVMKKMKDAEAGLKELVQKIQAASGDERPAMIKKYQEQVEALRRLLPELKTAAIKAYRAAPNESEKVNETLVGLVASDVRSDKYDSALELAKMMFDNKAEAKELNLFAGMANFCTQNFELAKTQLEQAKADGIMDRQGAQYLASVDAEIANWKNELEIRAKEAAADDLPRVLLTTSKGDITIELFENEAPQAVGNFVSLVENKFYDGLTFHRVLPGFMAQGGCPDGTGAGGPGYDIYCECGRDDHRKHFRGTMSMAHAGKDTGGSQFFLTFRPTPHLDGRHTAFGRVIEGMDVLADLQRIDPRRGGSKPDKIVKATVIRKRNHEYKPTKVKK